MKIIAPVRGWQMGREEEIAYAREHGIPVKGGSEAAPYSIDDNLWGRSSEGGPIEDLAEPPHDDVFQLVTAPEDAPDEAAGRGGGVRARPPGGARRRAARARGAARAGRGDRRPPRRGHRGPRGGPDRRAEGARPLRGARRRDHPAGAQGAREARGHHPPEQLQAAARQPVGLPRVRGALARAAAGGPERVHGVRERAGDRLDHDAALQGLGAAGGAAARPTPSTTRRWPASASRAGCSPSRRAPGSSSSGAFSREWRTRSGIGKREDS